MSTSEGAQNKSEGEREKIVIVKTDQHFQLLTKKFQVFLFFSVNCATETQKLTQ